MFPGAGTTCGSCWLVRTFVVLPTLQRTAPKRAAFFANIDMVIQFAPRQRKMAEGREEYRGGGRVECGVSRIGEVVAR